MTTLIDPRDAAVRQCPFPVYARLRREAPVYLVEDEGYYLATRADDCAAILGNANMFSSRVGPGVSKRRRPSPAVQAVIDSGYRRFDVLVSSDPPRHARYRSLVNKAFTPRRVSALEPQIIEIVDHLLALLPRQGDVDFMADFAVPLPLSVIADILGVPRENRDQFKKWSDDSVEIMDGIRDEKREIECQQSWVDLQHYFAAELEKRRAKPRGDFLSDLLAARTQAEEPLSTEELLSILYVLLVAGNETTTNLLSAAMLLLAENPEVQSRVRADPTLVPALVEEVLRLQAPVQGLVRRANQATTIGGVLVPAGATVVAMVGSANHDETEFPEPGEFDIDRPRTSSHLSFGLGRHFCLGAGLARLEARIAVERLVAARDWSLPATPGSPAYRPNFLFRGLAELHVMASPATGGKHTY